MAQGTAISYTPQLEVAVPAGLIVEPDMSCQADSARRVGMSAGTASSWVNGQRGPDPASCERIADGLGVDVGEVRTLVGHRPRVDSDEVEEVRRLPALMRGMPADVRRQVVEFAEWHRERLRRSERGG